jgi:hypothetical protein
LLLEPKSNRDLVFGAETTLRKNLAVADPLLLEPLELLELLGDVLPFFSLRGVRGELESTFFGVLV